MIFKGGCKFAAPFICMVKMQQFIIAFLTGEEIAISKEKEADIIILEPGVVSARSNSLNRYRGQDRP